MSARPPLFAKHRDYDHISAVEKAFFQQLTMYAHQFQGLERPGDYSFTVASAVKSVSDFLESRKDTTLSVLVCFDLHDCNPRNKNYADRMYLGTKLIPARMAKDQQVTHFIALTKGDVCEIKIHVDMDFDTSSDEPKPSPHLQVGGRTLKAGKQEFKIKWNDGLDKPRWPCLPYCTPLLWHSAFLEFQECESVRPFVRQPWWMKLVKDAEKALWEPFCDDMKAALSQGSVIESLYPAC